MEFYAERNPHTLRQMHQEFALESVLYSQEMT